MKIGILTFHRAENFGATLQAYALQTYLKQHGHVVEIIDYRCTSIARRYDIFNPSILLSRKNVLESLLKYIARFKNLKERVLRKKRFNEFWKSHLCFSLPVSKIDKPLDYDVYISGSDQIWNPNITKKLDKMFFLDFPVKRGAIKMSYAASSESKFYGMYRRFGKELASFLNGIDAISVREDALKSCLAEYTNKPISVCVDPTFLLSKEKYLELCISPVEHDYVLVYHLFYSQESIILAEKIALEKGLKVIEVHAGYVSRDDKVRHKQDLGPGELLGYINSASVIVTTSFHGLALSILLEKDVWVINTGANTRLKELLAATGLDNRIVSLASECGGESIDYTVVSENVRNMTLNSKTFLAQLDDQKR